MLQLYRWLPDAKSLTLLHSCEQWGEINEKKGQLTKDKSDKLLVYQDGVLVRPRKP